MEDITRPKYSCNPTSAPTSKLTMHKDSHVISKLKPKVRIIHIFAPEIIKTDVENFRELVQRLTGKPGDNRDHESSNKGSSGMKKNKKTRSSSICNKLMKKKKSTSFSMQLEDYGISSLIQEDKVKMEEENEIWGSNGENSNEFFDGFSDFNGFIHGLSDNVSLATPLSSHL
ncbi:VQ motif-containing protein 17-like [Ricinus communis]|uniref:VQ domain-containing protein n=1 Tax=Ricinus communis TaxID=3988 RepID=B9REM0_RICCO|nr:VQ motif-containing protein 17 [Ricinus communis]XP_025015907.1 VQ motif-containing protein 17-like [Ricinus communis]EEF50223.1 conserved hypothetical protein [Ricinus communis]|eukprot:XP_002512189.1 VQ motif-containing protein 17 [Ricinus communis]